jgi:hypothetical protein
MIYSIFWLIFMYNLSNIEQTGSWTSPFLTLSIDRAEPSLLFVPCSDTAGDPAQVARRWGHSEKVRIRKIIFCTGLTRTAKAG